MLPKNRSQKKLWRNVGITCATLLIIYCALKIFQEVVSIEDLFTYDIQSLRVIKPLLHDGSDSSDDSCMALKLHEGGHWEHHYDVNSTHNKSNIEKKYLPLEIDWMAGKHWPTSWGDKTSLTKVKEENGAVLDGVPLMFGSGLGNQGGTCGVSGFKPSLSTWVPAIGTTPSKEGTKQPLHERSTMSPSFRLIHKLAESNNVLCFAGDSIDLQFYTALKHNLNRQRLFLQNDEIDITINSTAIPVNFSDFGLPPYQKYWMTMDHIQETTVSLEYINNNGKSKKKQNAKFMFFKTYAWAPWNTLYMEDCNIVILNLGLHYLPNGDMHEQRYEQAPFQNDFRAAITYLVDFVSSKSKRLAVWRSALPQHFDTIDGHYVQGSNCSLKPLKPPKI